MLAYLVHVLMVNRQGLVVNDRVAQINGTAESEAGVDLVEARGESQRNTLGVGSNYDAQGFVSEMCTFGMISCRGPVCRGIGPLGRLIIGLITD